MNIERTIEILNNLKTQRQNKIFDIIKDFAKYGGKAEDCPVNWWGKNSNYPELYRIELQIERYDRMISRT